MERRNIGLLCFYYALFLLALLTCIVIGAAIGVNAGP